MPYEWLDCALSESRFFLREFGADRGKPVIYKDVNDETIVIDEALFLNKKTMKFKANKLGRGIYMRLLAETIKAPDEIRLMWGNDTGKKPLRRRYIKIFENTDGSPLFDRI